MSSLPRRIPAVARHVLVFRGVAPPRRWLALSRHSDPAKKLGAVSFGFEQIRPTVPASHKTFVLQLVIGGAFWEPRASWFANLLNAIASSRQRAGLAGREDSRNVQRTSSTVTRKRKPAEAPKPTIRTSMGIRLRTPILPISGEPGKMFEMATLEACRITTTLRAAGGQPSLRRDHHCFYARLQGWMN